MASMASFGTRSMSQPPGIKICCCRILTCINFGFVLSRGGLLKLMELGLAMLCEGLLIRYGVPYADSIGQALTSLLATTGHCFTTTGILLICYCFSDRSYGLIRQSLFVSISNIQVIDPIYNLGHVAGDALQCHRQLHVLQFGQLYGIRLYRLAASSVSGASRILGVPSHDGRLRKPLFTIC